MSRQRESRRRTISPSRHHFLLLCLATFSDSATVQISMQAEALSVDPFSTDWLAMAASDESRSIGCTASSNDPLAFLDDDALGQAGAQADSLKASDSQGGPNAADLSAWLDEYSATMNGAAGGGAVPPSMYGQSDMDMEASPFALSETSFSGASSLGYSNGTDLSSLFEPSSPFSSGSLFGSGAAASFASDFDSNALQALFAPVSGQTSDYTPAAAASVASGDGGTDGSQAAARTQGIPLQAVSPASTAASSFSPHAPPPPYLSPSNASALDFSLAVSPPVASAAGSPSFQANPESVSSILTRSGVAITSEQRPFTSLAAAAGIVVPPVAGSTPAVTHAYAGQASLAISQEAITVAQLGRAPGNATRGRTGTQPRVAVRPIAPNPVDTIANAGLRHEVHAPGACKPHWPSDKNALQIADSMRGVSSSSVPTHRRRQLPQPTSSDVSGSLSHERCRSTKTGRCRETGC